MREIKFRGKRIANGEWLYGDLIHVNEQVLIKPIFEEPYEYEEDFDENVAPETVGQYTGLKDKNGKEIYEGDIHKLGDEVGAVEYHDGTYFVLGEYCTRFLYQELTEQKGEVIGNIYEHPELLK